MSSGYTDELLRELNNLRMDPEGFADRVLVPMLDHFQDLKYCPPGAPAARTFEGVAAVKAAIDSCRSHSAVNPISRISSGLTRSASDLVKSNGPRGALDNVLEDGTQIGQRIVRYGKWRGKASETISFGNYPPREAIAQWVIDDGNPTRSQQATLLESRYQVVGMSSGPHKTYDLMTVVIFAEDFEEGADASDLKYSSTTTASRPLAAAATSAAPPAAVPTQAARSAPAAADVPSPAPTAFPSSSPVPASSTSGPTSSSSSRKESVLASDGDCFVIETDRLENASYENVKLRLEGRVLLLTIQTEDADAVRTKTMKWELPFVPQPVDIAAEFHDQKLKMLIEKPNRDVAAKRESVHIAAFSLEANPSGGKTQLEVEVVQTELEFVCRPVPSKFDEKIVVEHHNGEEIKFICTHEEEGIEGDSRVRKEITLTRVIRLPYPVPSSNIHATADNIVKISKAITDSSQSANIPIRKV